MKRVQFVGLDVHADTIAVAVAEPGGTVRSVGVIPNRPESIRKLVKQLGSPEHVRACYEASPTGYVIYWQLTALGVRCEVVAPSSGPPPPTSPPSLAMTQPYLRPRVEGSRRTRKTGLASSFE